MGKKRKQRKRFRKALRELSVLALGVLAEYAAEHARGREAGRVRDQDPI